MGKMLQYNLSQFSQRIQVTANLRAHSPPSLPPSPLGGRFPSLVPLGCLSVQGILQLQLKLLVVCLLLQSLFALLLQLLLKKLLLLLLDVFLPLCLL